MQRTRSTNEEEDDYHHSNIPTLTRTNDYHYYQIHTGSVFHVLTRSQSRRTLRVRQHTNTRAPAHRQTFTNAARHSLRFADPRWLFGGGNGNGASHRSTKRERMSGNVAQTKIANEIGSVGQAQYARAIHGRQIRAVHTLRRVDNDSYDAAEHRQRISVLHGRTRAFFSALVRYKHIEML